MYGTRAFRIAFTTPRTARSGFIPAGFEVFAMESFDRRDTAAVIREAVCPGRAEAFRHVDHELHNGKGVAEGVFKFHVLKRLLAKPFHGSLELVAPQPVPHGGIMAREVSPEFRMAVNPTSNERTVH